MLAINTMLPKASVLLKELVQAVPAGVAKLIVDTGVVEAGVVEAGVVEAGVVEAGVVVLEDELEESLPPPPPQDTSSSERDVIIE